MEREAESKILELITAQKFIDSQTETILIINRQPILDVAGELRRISNEANDKFKWLASQHNVRPIEVESRQEAVRTLELFV